MLPLVTKSQGSGGIRSALPVKSGFAKTVLESVLLFFVLQSYSLRIFAEDFGFFKTYADQAVTTSPFLLSDVASIEIVALSFE